MRLSPCPGQATPQGRRTGAVRGFSNSPGGPGIPLAGSDRQNVECGMQKAGNAAQRSSLALQGPQPGGAGITKSETNPNCQEWGNGQTGSRDVSSQAASNLDYWSAVPSRRLGAPADQRSAPPLNLSAAEKRQESGLDKLGCSKTGGVRRFYGTRTCPGFVQGAPRPPRGRRGRGVVFGRLMGKARSPKYKVAGQRRGSARRKVVPWKATQSHINATSTPSRSLLIAKR